MAALSGFTSQQLIRFEACLQQDKTATATVLQANHCALPGVAKSQPFETVKARWSEYPPMSTAIQVAIVQGQQDFTSVLSTGCITGNCTFPSTANATLSTLAITHLCRNATEALKMEYNSTVLTLGSGSGIRMETSGVNSLNMATAYSNIESDDEIGRIKLIARDTGNQWSPFAMVCSFMPSVNTYAVNITNSILEERLLDTIQIGVDIAWDPLPRYSSTQRQFVVARNSTLRDGVRPSLMHRTGQRRCGLGRGRLCKPRTRMAPGQWRTRYLVAMVLSQGLRVELDYGFCR